MSESKFITEKEKLCQLAPVAKTPLTHHIFVCNGKSYAAARRSKPRLRLNLKAATRVLAKRSGRNPNGRIMLTDCRSSGFCAIGAAVLIYPEGVCYAQRGECRRCSENNRKTSFGRGSRETFSVN